MLELSSAPTSFDYAYKSVPNKDTTTAIDLTSDDAGALNIRGITYSENGDQERAIAAFNKAIELKPDFVEAYNNRGIAYGIKGKYNRAIEDFDKAIALKPDYAIIYYNRGEALLHLGEWERARLDLMTAKNMEVDIIAAFCNDYKNVPDFERRNRVRLPADIAAMLTP